DRSIERSGYFVRRDRYQLGRGSVDLRYDISNNKVLKSRTWYESHAGIEKADLQDAGQRVGERVRSDDYGIGQTISFQHRLNGGRAVEFDWGVGIEHAVQRYHASRDPFTRRVQMDGEART